MAKKLSEQQVISMLQKLADRWPEELLLFIEHTPHGAQVALCYRDLLNQGSAMLNSDAVIDTYHGIIADSGDPQWASSHTESPVTGP